MNAWQGPGRQGRLRRKHRRDITGHNPLADLPQSAAGAGRENFDEITETPATNKKGYVPHDCKQYDLPSGALESLAIQNMQALGPSTNLEMALFHLHP
jgi:hypothetical protein